MLKESRLAERLPAPVYMDNLGNKVNDIEKSCGYKVETTFSLPQLCLVINKQVTRGNLNMMNDGHFGGQKFLTRKGDTAKINAAKKAKDLLYLCYKPIGWHVSCMLL